MKSDPVPVNDATYDGSRQSGTVGILTPTSSGSLGDQAMVDAATCHLTGEMGRKVLFGPNMFDTRSTARGPRGAGRLPVMAALANMALRSRSIGFIGADVLDGVYGAPSILKRLRVLRLAHRLGADARVFGCSWSLKPSAQVIAALRQADWLRLMARDPISQSRMEAALGRDIALVADLAFLLKPQISSAEGRTAEQWVDARRRDGMTVLGLNLSGHALRELPDHGVGAFAGLIGGWLEADARRAVLVLPHDRRAGLVGDMVVLSRLHDMLSDRFRDRMHLAPATLDAWEAKALAGKLDLVLTGRMHLAIAAMGMGTPALCTVYQGKFEGLMAHFGIEGLTFPPGDVLTGDCSARLEHVTARRAELGARISARLPAIHDLSRRNFEGMQEGRA